MIWWTLAIVLIAIEAFTFNLCTIWFAIGAASAGLAGLATDNMTIQIVVFFAVSVISLILTKPLVDRFRVGKEKTNVAGLIGKRARVTEAIDNSLEKGTVHLNGLDWTARSVDDIIIDAGTEVYVEKIDGVKLIVNREKI